MLTDDFHFHLPESSIAQKPLSRGQSRLLRLPAEGGIQHCQIRQLAKFLQAGDLLVANDTRVIPARLFGRRIPGGGRIEILLIEKQANQEWDALVKPGRRAKPGTRLTFTLESAPSNGEPAKLQNTQLQATVVAKGEAGKHRLSFNQEVEPYLDRLGHVPLPPYIKRPDEEEDRQTYQTIFARHPGAIAAPTAGLHFTPELLETLAAKGIERTTITLHVGIGTFKPVSAELVHEHQMDEERYEIPPRAADAINRTRARGGRVVAVGTTVVRTLESAALQMKDDPNTLPAGSGRTRLFITPGFRFRLTDLLLTNFHLPRSTLLMLVCAFAGQERVLNAYQQAIAENYRFYSYGDAMLLERALQGESPMSQKRMVG